MSTTLFEAVRPVTLAGVVLAVIIVAHARSGAAQDAGTPPATAQPQPAQPPPAEAAPAPPAEAPAAEQAPKGPESAQPVPEQAPTSPEQAPSVPESGTPAALVDGGVPLVEPGPTTAPPTMVVSPVEVESAGEIVVTAQRYEEDVQKTPVTVDAFSTRAMERRGVTNLEEVGKFTPNLQLQPTNRPAGGGSAYAAYIRGIGTGDFQFPTDPGVGLYIDDVYMARTIGGLLPIDPDIERVEVIKGPQGTLFGRNTIGGAINIVTAKPHVTGPAVGSVLLRLGDYGRKDFGAYANGPLLDNVIGAKLSVTSLHLDGYGERILDGQHTNGEERLVVHGGLFFKFSDDVNLRVDADYSRQNQTPPAGVMLRFVPSERTAAKIDKYNMFAAPALNPGLGLPDDSVFDGRWVSPGDHKTYALQPMYDRYHLGGVSGRLQWLPSEAFNLRSITAVRALSSDISVDGDQSPYPIQTSHTTLDDQQYSEELQATGLLLDRLQYMVGLYAFREHGHSDLDTQSYHGLYENEPMPIDADAGDTFTRFGLTTTSYAAFTQETLRIVDELHLTAGARITRDEKTYHYRVDFTQRDASRIPPTRAEASWTSFTPKLGLDWSPSEPVLLYASYSQGFKSGGFSASSSPNNPAPKYGPERVTAYEVGVKTHWFEGRKLMANLAFFYNDYRDIQLTVQSVDPITNANVRTTENAGRSKIKGFEAQVVTAPLPGLSLNAGAGYVDAKFDSLTPDAISTHFAIGERLPQIPDWTFNAGAQYDFDIGVGELTLRGDIAYKGKEQLTAADPTSLQAGYMLYSARIAFVPQAVQALEIALYGLNLSDQRYYIYHATLPPTGQELAIPGAPRLIYGSAKYMF